MAPSVKTLSPWKIEVLDYFVSMFETFGLPKSIAMIYGLLYCEDDPLSQEEVSDHLGISAGSASQGLRLLTTLGAVHRHTPVSERITRYTPERSLRRLLGYIVDAQIHPKLNAGRERLQSITDQLPEDDDCARQKIETLASWQRNAERALPMMSALFRK